MQMQTAKPGLAMPRISLLQAYKLRLKRRRMLWRSFRSRHQLTPLQDRAARIEPRDILCVTTMRNEAQRLPFFLEHHRNLGVRHFLIIDNGSDDGGLEMLLQQPDVSVWQTQASYREARFGLDWMTWLQMRYGHDHWVLMADVDELLVYDGYQSHALPDLTSLLEQRGQTAFGALMLDLFPKGPLDSHTYVPGQDPLEVLPYFDGGPYRAVRQAPAGNLWLQGGVRERMFFADNPDRSPTLNKIPLVKWNRRYAYINSCHSALPRHLNAAYDGPGGGTLSGGLLHTKFLPEIVSKSEIERRRGQHFHDPLKFEDYYDAITMAPDLWHPKAVTYAGDAQLVDLGLMSAIDWQKA